MISKSGGWEAAALAVSGSLPGCAACWPPGRGAIHTVRSSIEPWSDRAAAGSSRVDLPGRDNDRVERR